MLILSTVECSVTANSSYISSVTTLSSLFRGILYAPQVRSPPRQLSKIEINKRSRRWETICVGHYGSILLLVSGCEEGVYIEVRELALILLER